MKRLRLFIVAAAVALTGCGAPTPAEAPASSGPLVSRGFEAVVMPEWVSPGPRRLAAEFVAVAATPDARLDGESAAAWRRATPMMSPELLAELEGSSLGVVSGWKQLAQRDGYVTIEISNVVGDEPQAVPDPTAPSTPAADDAVELEVVFTRILHAEGRRDVRESEPSVWRVTVDDGQVTGLATVTTTSG